MSQENGVRPISKKDWNAINSHPSFPPVTKIEQLTSSNTPADSLKKRSIFSEFDLAEGEETLLQRYSGSTTLGYHYLLSIRREAFHRIHDLSQSASQDSEIQLRYKDRIKRVNEELGLGSAIILFEEQKESIPGSVNAVLQQFEEGTGDWPDGPGLDSGLIHKFNRERARNNKMRKHNTE